MHGQHAAYLDSVNDERNGWNPGDYAYQLTRRARGLPFWFSLAVHGADAYRAAVEQVLEITRAATERIRALPHLELLREPELSVVLFRRIGWDSARYAEWSAQLSRDQIALRGTDPMARRDGGPLGLLAPGHDHGHRRRDPRHDNLNSDLPEYAAPMKLMPRYEEPQIISTTGAPDDQRVPLSRQRRRLEATLAELNEGAWSAPSRCAAWSVQDVVAHLVSVNEFWNASVHAGLAGTPTRVLAALRSRGDSLR